MTSAALSAPEGDRALTQARELGEERGLLIGELEPFDERTRPAAGAPRGAGAGGPG